MDATHPASPRRRRRPAPAARAQSASVTLTRPHRDGRGVLAGGLRDPECGRHLLQEDDRRDADGEALDHRPRYEREEPAEPQRRPTPARSDRRGSPIAATAPAPSCATIGTSTTVIAPVGPETWKFEPPNTPATRPATIAVDQPGSRTEARRDAEREGERECDDGDRHAGDRVVAPAGAQPGVVGAPWSQIADTTAQRRHQRRATSAARSVNRSRVSCSDVSRKRFATASSSATVSSRSA